MPIQISNNFSQILSHVVHHIENPNYQTGTLIEEIPADIGRSYQGYKRGGILEGAEKLRKETMAAAVWLFGIPAFNKVGKLICENLLKIPMDMDFSESTIKDVSDYLMNGVAKDGIDVSPLKKYTSENFLKGMKEKYSSSQDLFKNIKAAKMITLNTAVILNCLMMGVVIPKVNQAITRNKIKKMNAKRTLLKPASFDSFSNRTSKKQPSFCGGIMGGITDGISKITYLTENSNKYRLIITDIPMITGRVLTSRNKYEALENAVIDGGSMFFYNFCAHVVQNLLRKATHIPSINPMVCQTLIESGEEAVKNAMDKVKDEPMSVDKLFDKSVADKIYSYSTFGKYGKINRYVSDNQIKDIDNEVFNYIKTLSNKIGYAQGKNFDWNTYLKEVKKYNVKNAAFLGVGFIAAIWGLATFLPKLAFRITTLITGRNEFTGIANFDDKKKNNVKIC